MSTPFVITCLIIGLLILLGGLMTDSGGWYRQLRKPAWNPPTWLFGPAWAVILSLAGWAGFEAWTQSPAGVTHLRLAVMFGATGLLHLMWSPLFFKLRRPDLSLLEIPFLWLSMLAVIIGVVRISTLSAVLFLPYLAWVAFATALNLAIVRLNAPFEATAKPSR